MSCPRPAEHLGSQRHRNEEISGRRHNESALLLEGDKQRRDGTPRARFRAVVGFREKMAGRDYPRRRLDRSKSLSAPRKN
ncbi:unnamed protein product, partial [Iphiclides podalirius]